MQKFYTLASKYIQRSKLGSDVVKYIIAGAASNIAGYLLYLAVTILLGVGHKTAMTGLYAIGVIINFYINRRWTFRSAGSFRYGMTRFILVIILGYFLNFVGLFIFVDLVGWSHVLVQAGIIPFMAIYFFIMNKFYVHT